MAMGDGPTKLLGYTLTWEDDDLTVEDFLSKNVKPQPRDSYTFNPCIVQVVESLDGFGHHGDLPFGKMIYVSGFSKQKRVLCCHKESRACFYLPTEYFPITCFALDPRTNDRREYSSLSGAVQSEGFPIDMTFERPLNLNVDGFEPFEKVTLTQESEEAYLFGNMFDADGYHLERSLTPLSSSLPLTVRPCKEAHHQSGGKNLEDLIDLVSRATADFTFSPCPPPSHATILRHPELVITIWGTASSNVLHHCPLGRNDPKYFDFSNLDLQANTISVAQRLKQGDEVHRFETIRTIPLLPSTRQRTRKPGKVSNFFESIRKPKAKTKSPTECTKIPKTPTQDQQNDGRFADDKRQAVETIADTGHKRETQLDRTKSLPIIPEAVSFAQTIASAQTPRCTELPLCGVPHVPLRKLKVGNKKDKNFGNPSQSIPETTVAKNNGNRDATNVTTKMTPATLKGAGPVKAEAPGLITTGSKETQKPSPTQAGIDRRKQGAGVTSDGREYCESPPLSSTYLSMSRRKKTSERQSLHNITALPKEACLDVTNREGLEDDDCVYEKIWHHTSVRRARCIDNWSTVPQDLDDLSVENVSQCLKLLEMSQYIERVALDRVDGGILSTLDFDMLINHFKFDEIDARKFQKFLEGWRPRWSTETDSSESTYDICEFQTFRAP